MQFQREELLIGTDNVKRLKDAHVAVFGLGGVGGFTVEALVRAGVGKLTIVDFDTVDITNINRQIIALHSTVGMDKTELIRKRALEINPNIVIEEFNYRYTPEDRDMFFKDKKYDYVVDAIDIVTGKLDLIVACKSMDIPIISSMGTGNKLEPTKLEVTDISKTSVCPLARVMRLELKKRRIKKVKVLFSTEVPRKPFNEELTREKSRTVGSISFVPSVAGLIIAGEVVKDLCEGL